MGQLMTSVRNDEATLVGGEEPDETSQLTPTTSVTKTKVPPITTEGNVRNSASMSSARSPSTAVYVPPKPPKSNEEIDRVIHMGMQKLADMRSVAFLKRNEEGKKFLSRNLVLKEHLLKYYMSLDLVPALTPMLVDSATNNPSLGESTPESVPESTSEAPRDTDDEDDEQTLKNTHNMMNQLSRMAPSGPIMRSEESLKVKLVIIEMSGTDTEKKMRRFLSPIMDTFRLAPTFGLVHSALIVGPWYLEWNNSSLCIPRRCCSGAALVAADVETVLRGTQVSVAMDRISDVVCHWNGNITYSKQKYNCQTFVDELCTALGIKLNFQGALSDFLKNLRYSGQCELNYVPRPDMMKKLGREEGPVQFKTHRELDDFVNAITTHFPTYFDLDDNGVDDWKLLKSFDRAFWLRKFKHDTEQYEPHNCPFKNPLDSGSILDWKSK